MKLRIMSDLHLEFSNGIFNMEVSSDESNTVLVLAGDIGLAKRPLTYKPFIENMSDRFKHVIYINGNHEHYRGSILTSHSKIWTECIELENVHVLENETCVIDGVAFIGATLWTNFNKLDPMCMEQARWYMNDFKLIRTGSPEDPYNRKFQPIDAINLFTESKKFIFDEIKKQKDDGNKVVVVTHHGPSYLSVAAEFKGDEMNGAYVSELYEDISAAKPDVFIHGHTHVSFDYNIEDTRVICNPQGYFPNDLNPNFDPMLTIEL